MDSFELVVSGFLRRKGYWVWPSFKVELTKPEKVEIGRKSSPRWEIDLVAYKGATNEVVAVECKSFLNSPGISFETFLANDDNRYKLFSDETLRRVVLNRLRMQLVQEATVAPNPTIRLGLASGHIRTPGDRQRLHDHFRANDWLLWDDRDIALELQGLKGTAYEDDVAALVAKLIDVAAKDAR